MRTTAVHLAVVILMSLLMPSRASAQVARGSVTVPIIDTFTMSTVVSVPDRGSMYLGGMRGASDRRNEAGLDRGISNGRNASSVDTRVYIHDLQEMDEETRRKGRSMTAPIAKRDEGAYANAMRKYASTPASPSRSSSPRKSSSDVTIGKR